MSTGGYCYEASKSVHTTTSDIAVGVTRPCTIVVYLPDTGDELRPQSSVIDPCEFPCGREVSLSQSPLSTSVVEVHIGGRAIWNQCFVDGSVVSVPAIELFVPGDVDCPTVVKVEHQCSGKGKLTGVTSLESGVIIHTQWSDRVRGQRLIAGQNTTTNVNIHCT